MPATSITIGLHPPAPVPEVDSPMPKDALRLLGWAWRARVYSALRGSVVSAGLLVAVAVVVVWSGWELWDCAVLLVSGRAAVSAVVGAVLLGVSLAVAVGAEVAVRRRHLRRAATSWYGGVADGAVLAVTAKVTASGPTWVITDHLSAHPGRGLGRELRRRIVRPLIEQADACGVTITCTTSSRDLAEAYRDQLPDLKLVRRDRLGLYHLARDPLSGPLLRRR